MRDTSWTPRTRADVAMAYGFDEERGHAPLPPYALATWPDGGLHGSARDMGRFLSMAPPR